jgi:hypothetical protein
VARHDELGTGEGHRVRAVGVVGTHEIKRPLRAGPAQVAQVLRLLTKLGKAGVIGEGNGRHRDLLSPPAVRYAGLKGGTLAIPFIQSSIGWARPCPRTGGVPYAQTNARPPRTREATAAVMV